MASRAIAVTAIIPTTTSSVMPDSGPNDLLVVAVVVVVNILLGFLRLRPRLIRRRRNVTRNSVRNARDRLLHYVRIRIVRAERITVREAAVRAAGVGNSSRRRAVKREPVTEAEIYVLEDRLLRRNADQTKPPADYIV